MEAALLKCSNLERVLNCTTPVVHSFIKHNQSGAEESTCLLGQGAQKGAADGFMLEELWECYDEWSVYGAEVPIILGNRKNTFQYYVPYLSALQIYTNKPVTSTRTQREDSDGGEIESDSWSDDSESDKLSRSLSNNSSRGWDVTSDDSSLDQDAWWPTRERLGDLYCQYIEKSSPYGRIPLIEKIGELAVSYSGLLTFKSDDLSPASWMSVAWYPIYHIPEVKNVKELSACFLTYHTLASSYQGLQDETFGGNVLCEAQDCSQSWQQTSGKAVESDTEIRKIPLLPFGLATFKMQSDFWIKPGSGDQNRVCSLLSAADSWLKQLRVQHHDFNYFVTRSV